MAEMGAGALAFLIGIVLALLIGINNAFGLIVIEEAIMLWVIGVMVVAGAIVGFLNIANAESVPFVVGVLALTILVGLLSGVPQIPELVQGLAQPVIAFLAPAAVIVAVVMVVRAAKN